MPQITLGDDLKSSNGLVLAFQEVTSTHSITSTSGPNSGHDYMIGVDTTSSALAVNLPTDTSREVGRMYYVMDTGGNAGTNNITIDAGSGNLIEDAQTAIIASDNVSLGIVYIDDTGKKWKIV
jgi:hypothetical protein